MAKHLINMDVIRYIKACKFYLSFPRFLFLSLHLPFSPFSFYNFPLPDLSRSSYSSPYIFTLCAFFDCMQCFFFFDDSRRDKYMLYIFILPSSFSRPSQSCCRNYNFILFGYNILHFLRNDESCLSL